MLFRSRTSFLNPVVFTFAILFDTTSSFFWLVCIPDTAVYSPLNIFSPRLKNWMIPGHKGTGLLCCWKNTTQEEPSPSVRKDATQEGPSPGVLSPYNILSDRILFFCRLLLIGRCWDRKIGTKVLGYKGKGHKGTGLLCCWKDTTQEELSPGVYRASYITTLTISAFLQHIYGI